MNFPKSAPLARFSQDFRKYYIGKRLTCQATQEVPTFRQRSKFLLLFLLEITANDSTPPFAETNCADRHFPYRIRPVPVL